MTAVILIKEDSAGLAVAQTQRNVPRIARRILMSAKVLVRREEREETVLRVAKVFKAAPVDVQAQKNARHIVKKIQMSAVAMLGAAGTLMETEMIHRRLLVALPIV